MPQNKETRTITPELRPIVLDKGETKHKTYTEKGGLKRSRFGGGAR